MLAFPFVKHLVYQKSKNKDIKIAAADPMGAAMYNWIKTGELKAEDGGSIAMSQVRYDATVRNFYPAGHKPAPGGRLYRRAVPAERPAAGVE